MVNDTNKNLAADLSIQNFEVFWDLYWKQKVDLGKVGDFLPGLTEYLGIREPNKSIIQ